MYSHIPYIVFVIPSLEKKMESFLNNNALLFLCTLPVNETHLNKRGSDLACSVQNTLIVSYYL